MPWTPGVTLVSVAAVVLVWLAELGCSGSQQAGHRPQAESATATKNDGTPGAPGWHAGDASGTGDGRVLQAGGLAAVRADVSRDLVASSGLPQKDGDRRLPGTSCKPIAASLRNSLAVAPKKLWSVAIFGNGGADVAALSRRRLGVSVGNSFFICDARGHVTRWMNAATHSPLSEPVADGDGNFYFTSDVAASIDGRGKVRWQFPLRTDDVREGHKASIQPFVLSPDGILYSMQSDGLLAALEKDTGKVVWQKRLTIKASSGGTTLLSGAGNVLVVEPSHYDGVVLVDRRTGDTLAQYRINDPDLVLAPNYFFPGIGYFGFNAVELTVGNRLQVIYNIGVLDSSRQKIWSEPHNFDVDKTGLGLGFVDPRGLLAAWESATPLYATAQPYRLRYYTCTGEIESTVNLPAPPQDRYFTGAFTLGADGVLYALTNTRSSTPSCDVYALAPDGTVKWSMTFDGLYPFGSSETQRMPLSDDGVLYVVLQEGIGATVARSRIIAIQTTSPGLARTAYPIRRYNNENTGWAAR